MSDIVERLHIDAACLRKMVDHAKFAGPETDVRVKSPGLLLESLSEAAEVIGKQRALIKTLVKALERIASVCSDRSEKTGWRIDSISDEADAALAAAKEQSA